MLKKSIRLAVIVGAVIVATGCASVQMASPDQDAQAKAFATKADKAHIYVYRNEVIGAAVKMPVALNGKLVGDTVAKSFIRLEVPPGEHTLVSKTENDAVVKVNAVAGRNHFVWQEVKMGMFAARSALTEVDEATGRQAVQECKLVASTY